MTTQGSLKTPWKASNILLFYFIFILFVSFKNKDEASISGLEKDPQVQIPSNLEYLGSFNMDYEKFLSFGGSWDRRLIMQFKTRLTDAGSQYDVVAYLATSHADHAANETPVPLTSLTPGGIQLEKGKTYFFGNNYIRLRTIKKYIKEVTEQNSDATIKYLRFTAVSLKVKEPDSPFFKNLEPGQIFFIIQAFDTNNNLYKTTTNDVVSEKDLEEGGVFSNPSPPADPSNND